MPSFTTRAIAGGVFAIGLGMALPVTAETLLEQGPEHRYQLDFHVPDAALQKMLPAGWVPAVATAGPAKDANLRMIFIDRIGIVGPDGKPLGRGTSRLAYLAVPVKQTSGEATGQMIIAGLVDNAADAPGAFGVYQYAPTAKMTRSVGGSTMAPLAEEDWDFAAPSGEHMQVHVKYERAAAAKGGGEVKFFNPSDPTKYQIFKTEQATDITRNATTHPPDRVKEFSYHAGGGRIAALFDGTEKVLSWDSQPWYNRSVIAP
ncbi:MAG TPA: hypothetical protein VHT51_08205 [Micropepsaceae bacterium]|jgi:hypothetical protein|nr:hypothetical protein [Micropepsaceae bacterium]